MAAGCRDVGQPAASGLEILGTQSSSLPERPQCHTPLWSHHQPQAQALCSQALLMTHWCCPRMEQCRIPTTAASVTDDPQHLCRIHNLLPGFAGSFASCHFSSINLLPVREGNRTDPWGDGERRERELNQVRTSSASPPHRQGPDVAAKLPFSDTVSELSLAMEK